jgi:hypothetical protein
MSRKVILFLSVGILLAGMASCELLQGSVGVASLAFGEAKLELDLEGTAELKVSALDSRGKAENFSVSVADPELVSVEKTGNTIRLTGTAPGSTVVTITSASGRIGTINITVRPATLNTIEELMAQWLNATHELDLEAFMACYWDHAVYYSVDGLGRRSRKNGSAEIRAFMEGGFSQQNNYLSTLQLPAPHIFLETANGFPEYVYANSPDVVLRSFQFELRNGIWKIRQHDAWLRMIATSDMPSTDPDTLSWAGVAPGANPIEFPVQRSVWHAVGLAVFADQNLSVAGGPAAWAWFDHDKNGQLDSDERERIREEFFRNRVRRLARYYPGLDLYYLAAPEDQVELSVFHTFRILPIVYGDRHLGARWSLGWREDMPDINRDGYLSYGEKRAYEELILRLSCLIPEEPFHPGLVLDQRQALIDQADTSGDGSLDEEEWLELGFNMFWSLYWKDRTVRNALDLAFDSSGQDWFLSGDEIDSARAELFGPSLVRAFDTWSLLDPFPYKPAKLDHLLSLDLDENGELDESEQDAFMAEIFADWRWKDEDVPRFLSVLQATVESWLMHLPLWPD